MNGLPKRIILPWCKLHRTSNQSQARQETHSDSIFLRCKFQDRYCHDSHDATILTSHGVNFIPQILLPVLESNLEKVLHPARARFFFWQNGLHCWRYQLHSEQHAHSEKHGETDAEWLPVKIRENQANIDCTFFLNISSCILSHLGLTFFWNAAFMLVCVFSLSRSYLVLTCLYVISFVFMLQAHVVSFFQLWTSHIFTALEVAAPGALGREAMKAAWDV